MNKSSFLLIENFSDGRVRVTPQFAAKNASPIKTWGGLVLLFLFIQGCSLGFVNLGSGVGIGDQINFFDLLNRLNIFGILGLIGFFMSILLVLYSVLLTYRPSHIEWNTRNHRLNLRYSPWAKTLRNVDFNEIQTMGFRDQGLALEFFVQLRKQKTFRLLNWFQIPLQEWQRALEPLSKLSRLELTIEPSASGATESVEKSMTLPIVVKDGSARRHKVAAIGAVLAMLWWAYVISNSLQSGHWDLVLTLIPLVATSFALPLMRSKVVRIDHTSVKYEAKGWWKTHWQESLRHYDGITIIENKDDNFIDRKFILKHTDSAKSVQLAQTRNKNWGEDRKLLDELVHLLNVPNLFELNQTELAPRSSHASPPLQLPWNEEWKYKGLSPLLFGGLFFGIIALLFTGLAVKLVLDGSWASILVILFSLIPWGVAGFLVTLTLGGKGGLSVTEESLTIYDRVPFYQKTLLNSSRREIEDIVLIQKTHKRGRKIGSLRVTLKNGTQEDFGTHFDPESQRLILQRLRQWLG